MKKPSMMAKPKKLSATLPSARSRAPFSPSKSSVSAPMVSGTPATLSLVPSLKSTTMFGSTGLPSSVPLVWLRNRERSVMAIVTLGTPTNSAALTWTLSAMKLRRSVVGGVGGAGCFVFMSASAKLASETLKPSAPSLVAGPLTPMKALTPTAPIRSWSTSRLLPSPSLTVALDFSMTKKPSIMTKPKALSSTLPSMRSSVSLVSAASKLGSRLPESVAVAQSIFSTGVPRASVA